MNEIIEMEIVHPVDDKLVKYAGETGLEKPATETLVEAFRPVFSSARAALADARGVAESVTDATCVTEIRQSRACRLAIRAVRLEGEAVHKKQKESALRYGRAVDGFKNILLAEIVPVETALQSAEDYAERAENARREALRSAREKELSPFLETHPAYWGDLSQMPEAIFQKLVTDAKLLRQAKIDEATKREFDRIAKEKAERIERERITAENARLQAEKEEAEKAAKEVARLAEVERQRIEGERAKERRKVKDEADRIEAAHAEERRQALFESDRLAEAVRQVREKAESMRAAIEGKAKVERETAAKETARLKAELAAKDFAAVEAKAKLERERSAAKKVACQAAAAPDLAKLKSFTSALRQMPQPEFRDKAIGLHVSKCLEETALRLEGLLA